jgi:hypothetical protein
MGTPKKFKAGVDPAKEISEIATDFVQPHEVLREALHNAYDAGATEVLIRAYAQTLAAGDRVLTLEIRDNGFGMTDKQVEGFFGLGFSNKERERLRDREVIGFKGHGTKIFYQAQDVFVLTQRENSERLLAIFEDARKTIHNRKIPEIVLFRNGEAATAAADEGLTLIADHGTSIRLVGYMANSAVLIDEFSRRKIVDYLRWFTVYGSFREVFQPEARPPLVVELQATDDRSPAVVDFGHPWPKDDVTDLNALRRLDPRRPYGDFRKSFKDFDRGIAGGYRISIAVLFEGRRGRLRRDHDIRRQKVGGLYREEDRYGLWLCKDFIPIEPRFEWLSEEDCPLLEDAFDLGLSRPLIFVNCQDFSLTANRGSVGNSSDTLLTAVRIGVFDFLRHIQNDSDYKRFRLDYREDLFARLREKDRSALQRRIERYNRKKWLTIDLPGGGQHRFFEPQREITLFGLLTQLEVLTPGLIDLDVLDYDDHSGIDLLVRRRRDPHDLVSKDRPVYYAEIKFILEPQVNHPFANLAAIICWDTGLHENDPVTDSVNDTLVYSEVIKEGVTYCHLRPDPSSDNIKHVIRVYKLKQLLLERCGLREQDNPNPVDDSPPRATTRRVR